MEPALHMAEALGYDLMAMAELLAPCELGVTTALNKKILGMLEGE